MSDFPVSWKARRRLLEAQRAEGGALSAVTRAQVARAKVQMKVDAADVVVATAIRQLVDSSGRDRAAQLLDMRPAEVRRWVRLAKSAENADDTVEGSSA